MKLLLRHLVLMLILAVTLSAEKTFAQVSESSRYKSRLDIKPKAKVSTTTSTFVWNPNIFTHFQPYFLSLDRKISVKNSNVIRDYFATSLLNINNKTPKPETVVVVNVPEVIERKSEETSFSSPEEKLFSNEKLTVSNIYPNPADDHVEIDYVLSPNVKEAKIKFYNVFGVEVKDTPLEKDDKKVRISTQSMNNGVYLYELSADGKSLVTKKLLVRHQ
jgi:Secretion system C-terminal sorting domain